MLRHLLMSSRHATPCPPCHAVGVHYGASRYAAEARYYAMIYMAPIHVCHSVRYDAGYAATPRGERR